MPHRHPGETAFALGRGGAGESWRCLGVGPTKRRILLVVEERYVVVLEQRKNPGGFSFLTAFPADQQYVEKIRRESTFLRKQEAPVLTATEAQPRSRAMGKGPTAR